MPTIVDRWRTAVEDNPLRQWRIEHRMSINECAALLGVTPVTLTKWERGSTPKEENLNRIAAITDNAVTADLWEQWRKTLPSYE